MSQLAINFRINVTRYRAEKGLSLIEFANILGMTKTAVYNWERGKLRPSLNNIVIVAEKMGISEVELVSDSALLEQVKPESIIRIPSDWDHHLETPKETEERDALIERKTFVIKV